MKVGKIFFVLVNYIEQEKQWEESNMQVLGK